MARNTFWDRLLEEVHRGYVPLSDEIDNELEDLTLKDSALPFSSKKSKYYLPGYPNSVYLTYRETECFDYMLQGASMKKTAEMLSLSPRTVESYINNVKAKLKCRTKLEAIDKIVKAFIDEVPVK